MTDVADTFRALEASAPRGRHAIQSALTLAIHEEPERASALPDLDAVAPEVRGALAELRALALRRLGDVAGLRALLARCEPTLRWRIVHALGNAPPAERAPFAPIAAEALADADPDVRHAGLYFFSHAVAAGTDLAPFAGALLGCAADPRKGASIKKSVASVAGRVVREARAASATPAAFDRGAAKQAARAPQSVAAAIRELRSRDLEARGRAIDALTGWLVDMRDVQEAYRYLPTALLDPDPGLREKAALLGYYACDLQGTTDDARALRPALETAARDPVPAVREHAEAALRALARQR